MSIKVTTAPAAPSPEPLPASKRQVKLDPFEVAALVIFAAISLWVKPSK